MINPIERKTKHILPKKIAKERKNHANWDSCHLKQFSNVLPWFCSFCVFLEDRRLGKIEHFIVIRVKTRLSVGQDFVQVYIVHLFWNFVWDTYPCLWPRRGKGNEKGRRLSKRWAIVWIQINCTLFIFCQAFERWQGFAVAQREDEGFESLAPPPSWRRLCKTRKQSVNIRTVQ